MTDPVANTPDDGSDFYNTPVNPGTPITGTQTSLPATQPAVSSKMAPIIPGLGLVGPNDQYAREQPAQTTTIKQEPDAIVSNEEHGTDLKMKETGTEIKMEDLGEAVTQQLSETTIKQERGTEQGEAMEIDQNTTEAKNVKVADGVPAEQDGVEIKEEEHPEWEVDSSPYESSSDSSSSSDSDDSDDEDYPILSPEEQARILMMAEAGSDDEGDSKGKTGGQIRSAHEVDEVLPIPDVKITPEMEVVYLGKVQAAIDNAVLIEANTSGEYQVLESGSLLCTAERQLLGVVAETLGRVENPLYTLMYATAEEAQEKGVVKDLPVYYVVKHSTFVFTQPLKGLKGSDASNFHDEEVAEDEIEFSDDEAEADYRKKLKQKRQERKEAKDGALKKRGPAGPSKLGHNELNYDEEAGQDGYTPLSRPTNLHEMMGVREAPVEGSDRTPSFRGGRGRGRGSDRGRGGRGRGSGGRGGAWERDQERRSHPQQGGNSSYGQPAAAPQPQPAEYSQHPWMQGQQQQPDQAMPQNFAGYQQFAPQQQMQYPQGQFPFQFPFQQGFVQPFQPIPTGAHINPLFLAALQQQQQQQQPGQSQPLQPLQQQQFDQVKAQLDLLRSLSNGNQGPPPS
ncbi:hypothetical protein N7495_002370 [Penicillium taxi]|uniref:uncharacterized protein n=1 Tax=Penicillium taxi TaxID=168475 RepID=UPI002544F868|nr:uncharacterized protein N7495_002370 [Penicillium taxi]KAJ5901842.1 hypothetical protein N7495_002370 [Penicillium taxi]